MQSNNAVIGYYIRKRGNDANDRVYTFLEFSALNINAGLNRFYRRQDSTLDPVNGFNENIRDTRNVTINKLNFPDCIKYVYEKGPDWCNEYIYAKNVGLISYKLKGKNKWNLIKYNIVK
ncbi:MAG: hypothetical protein SGJ10_11435 [Bacteroidota bacterium]|nr:hypothetical protein [Bacteroidota bacterium]